jgi:hypothetical protein
MPFAARTPTTLAELFSAKKNRLARIGSKDRDRLKSALRVRPQIAVGDIEGGLADAYDRAMNVRLIDCFAGGWSKLAEIAAYGDTTKYPAGSRHFVPLARHTITSRHEPKIEVLIDGVKIMELPFEVALSAAFEAAVLEIEGGKIRGIRSGSGVLSGLVSAHGVTLASVRALSYRFPGHTKIDPPFALPGTGKPAIHEPAPPDRRKGDGPTLVLSGHDDGGRTVRLSIPLAADPAGKTRTIGRNPEQADLVIAHKSVSSLHAGIRVTDRGVELCDLGSSNGTRVDGKRIGRDYVSIDGAKRISLGACELTASRS